MRATPRLFMFSVLVFSLAFATAPVPCQTDEDCQEANQGNVCMDGICGFAQEPAIEETVENCITDDFCASQGYDYCGDDGTCVPHEPLEDVMEEIDNCVTNEFCVGEGYDLCGAQGHCANESRDACATDYFCSTLGYDFCSLPEDCNYSAHYGLMRCQSAGFCDSENPYGVRACENDEYCQENNLGNECIGGVCAWSQPPVYDGCLPAYMVALAFASALFASRK